MVRITNEGYPKDEQILLDTITCTYYQENDCTEDRDGDGQQITLSTRDGGGGKFIHIQTDGWSISGIEDLEILIANFKSKYE